MAAAILEVEMTTTESRTGVRRPLDGIRVIEVGGGLAASYTTKLLAAFGAEVIKVERPKHGDSVRRLGPFANDVEDLERSIPFLDLNLSKKSLTLDIASSDGKAVLDDLLSTSAALVDSLSPPARARMGRNLDETRVRHPDLVVCSLTSFGEDGPYRDREASEIVLYGMGHAMHGTGTKSGGPIAMAPYLGLLYSGLNAAVPLVASLLRRNNSGVGEHIDFSIFESFVASIDRRADSIVAYEYCGDPLERPTGDEPESRYTRCNDGFVAVGLLGRTWGAVLQLMEVDEADRERLMPPWSNEDDHAELLERWKKFASTKGRYELSAMLQQLGVGAAPVNTVKDVLSDAHLAERGVFKTVHHDVVGDHMVIDVPIRMSATPGRYETSAPLLGADTDAVLESIGYDRARINDLRERGIV
jgi:crotonobetainyl-CoA:carnitine CoA-transferase CaiB-like acyl-CoA transferase